MKNLKTILTVFTLLTSCTSSRIIYLEDKDLKFCKDIIAINKIVMSDKEMIDYFSNLDKDSLIFYCDTTLLFGFNQLFMYDLSLIRAKNDSTKNQYETYYDLSMEQQKYIKKRNEIKLACSKNGCSRKIADLEVNYWFDPIDIIYSLDIVEILKEPGYSKGYMFLISKKDGNIEIIKRSGWVE